MAMQQTNPDPPSLLYSSLPTAVQRHVPRLPSLRRTASTYSRQHIRTGSDASVEPRTPPPPYPTSQRNSMVDSPDITDGENVPLTQLASRAHNRPDVDDNGLQWNYAKQGLAMLAMCAREDSLIAHDAELRRQVYLDGVGYLLRGMPTDLTADELTGLKIALPAQLRNTAEHRPDQGLNRTARLTQRRSIMHRLVAASTLYTVLAMAFFLPYAQSFLQQAYTYERRWRLCDRAVAISGTLINVLWRRLLLVVAALFAMGDGEVGRAVTRLGLSCLEAMFGGAQDGMAEAMAVLRSNTAPQEDSKTAPAADSGIA